MLYSPRLRLAHAAQANSHEGGGSVWVCAGRSAAPVMMAKRILVVEDEQALARLIQVNLEKEGYATHWAPTGAEALAAVADSHPDLIILDVVMPVMDGFAVLRELKADPDTADIPVMMLTAKSDEGSIYQGWAEGVHCYMTKPFDPNDLLVFVARTLDEQAGLTD